MLYYLSLGANLGNREDTILRAVELLEATQGGQSPLCGLSSFYYSPADEFESEHEFCNCCAVVTSELEPLDFLHLTQRVELQLGRKRKSEGDKHFDREIDIDILLAFPTPLSSTHKTDSLSVPNLIHSSLHLSSAELTLPHPKMQERGFVMGPLQEILQKNA